ncbi:MAG: hypothetical protein WD077_01350 [Bacteroidia bacterium]
MKHSTALFFKKNRSVILLLISALLITNFLFFIDEGYYDFRWMKRLGNWIPFVVYAGAIFLAQLGIYHLILNRYKGRGKTVLSILGGATLGIIFVISLIFTN